MTDRFHCRYCRGVRDFSRTICLGCGSPRCNAIVASPKLMSQATKPRCPGCGSTLARQIGDGRWVCGCGSVFEAADFNFLDDRAEKNLEKKERMARR